MEHHLAQHCPCLPAPCPLGCGFVLALNFLTGSFLSIHIKFFKLVLLFINFSYLTYFPPFCSPTPRLFSVPLPYPGLLSHF